MPTVKGKGAPKGFSMIPEGEQVVRISDVKGLPREGVKIVTMKMLNEDGLGWDKFPQKYDLESDGGYAAFYYLVSNGLGVDLNEDEGFDIDQLEGAFVLVDVIHKEVPRKDGNGNAVFANIKATIGPGEPFGTDGGTADDDEEYD